MIIGIDASRAARAKRTGTEQYSLAIIRHLLALPHADRHHWRLYLQDFPTPGLFGSSAGLPPHVTLCVLPSRRAWTHRALASEISHHPPDLLFVPAHVIPFRPPWHLPPTVATVHDLGYRHLPHTHTRFQRLYLELTTRWNAAVAKRIVTVSHFTAADLTRSYGTVRSKIRVIYEAPVDRNVRMFERSNVQMLPARSYALYLGTVQPRKNLARIVEAYISLHRQVTLDWDLVLAGKPGWLSDGLYRMAQDSGLSERIHFPGYISDASVDEFMGNARFFVFPSLFEGFGLPVLEAQQKGVPVMCSNNSALPEIAGDAALLVDPTDVDAIADAMLRLSQDEELRQRLIAAGYENVKRFSWERAARQTLEVLEEAASVTLKR